jgi:ATP-dependent RNA helicase RhlE
MSFSQLGLSPAVIDGITAKGYTTPTPIQAKAIPLVLTGRDVIGSAQTGTGKTAAFALPILTRIAQAKQGGPRVLVLEPTRELAAQVEVSFRELGCKTNLRTGVVFGGVGYGNQTAMLRAGHPVSPGRCG